MLPTCWTKETDFHTSKTGISEPQESTPTNFIPMRSPNLGKLAKGKVTIRQNGPTWALFFDGNLEASLILLDEMWDSALRSYHSGEPVIALPARDVLCFCDASSPAGVAELRALVSRLWPEGDHLISDRLFRRRGGRWVPYDDVS